MDKENLIKNYIDTNIYYIATIYFHLNNKDTTEKEKVKDIIKKYYEKINSKLNPYNELESINNIIKLFNEKNKENFNKELKYLEE